MKVAQAVNYWPGLQCNIFFALKFGERFGCNFVKGSIWRQAAFRDGSYFTFLKPP